MGDTTIMVVIHNLKQYLNINIINYKYHMDIKITFFCRRAIESKPQLTERNNYR